MMLQRYKKLDSSIKSVIAADTEGTPKILLTLINEQAFELMGLIVEIIRNQKYLKQLQIKYSGLNFMTKLMAIISNISELLAVCHVPMSEANFLKRALIGQIARDKEAEEKSASNVRNRFIEGNDFDIADIQPVTSSFLDEKIQEEQIQLTFEHTQIRDLDMVESLDKDLRKTQSSLGKRCGFYAIGYFHLMGKYEPNLVALLREKGWDVVRVDLNTKSFSNQGFFACPINDKKGEGAQPYKPENLIQVRQYLSNIS